MRCTSKHLRKWWLCPAVLACLILNACSILRNGEQYGRNKDALFTAEIVLNMSGLDANAAFVALGTGRIYSISYPVIDWFNPQYAIIRLKVHNREELDELTRMIANNGLNVRRVGLLKNE